MLVFIAKRVLTALPILVGISIVAFLMMHLIPGDVVDVLMQDARGSPEVREQLRSLFGLDQPILVQYFRWLARVLQGDLGTSFITRIPVAQEISLALPVTLELAFAAILFATLIGVPLGVLSAVRGGGLLERVSYFATLVGLSMPSFWLAILLLLFFSTTFSWVPPQGQQLIWRDPLGALTQMVLPALALGVALAAMIMRMTRASMLEVLQQDYIRTASSKGLMQRKVVFKHALRNALIPVITLIGLQFGYLLGGTIVIEEIFSLPGIGRLVLRSIYQRDFPLIQGALLFVGFSVVVLNLLIDIVYSLANPRIRYQ